MNWAETFAIVGSIWAIPWGIVAWAWKTSEDRQAAVLEFDQEKWRKENS